MSFIQVVNTRGDLHSALSAFGRRQHSSTSSWRMRVRSSPPYNRLVSCRSCGLFPSTSQSSRYSCTRPTRTSQTLANRVSLRVSISTVRESPCRQRTAPELEWQILDLGVEILFILVPVGVEMLLEVTLVIEQANTNEGVHPDRWRF